MNIDLPTPAEIKEHRERLKLTQKAAADIVHVTPQAWQRFEYGSRTPHKSIWELFLIKTDLSRNVTAGTIHHIVGHNACMFITDVTQVETPKEAMTEEELFADIEYVEKTLLDIEYSRTLVLEADVININNYEIYHVIWDFNPAIPRIAQKYGSQLKYASSYYVPWNDNAFYIKSATRIN